MPLDPVIREQLRDLPKSPGVYLFKDGAGSVIYVGKAVNLKNRVRSYFNPRGVAADNRLKIKAMIRWIRRVDTIVVKNEAEALILESRLLKEYKPKYNTDFVDDKRFLLIRVTNAHPQPLPPGGENNAGLRPATPDGADAARSLPRFELCRNRVDISSIYYGPFVHGMAIKQLYFELRRKYGVLLSDGNPKRISRPTPQPPPNNREGENDTGLRPATPASSGGNSGSLVEDPEQASLKINFVLETKTSASKGETIFKNSSFHGANVATLYQLYDDARGEIFEHPNVVTRAEYMERVNKACAFLDGRTRLWREEVFEKMQAAAEARRFEEAARWRDLLQALRRAKNPERKFLRDPLLKILDPQRALEAIQEALKMPELPASIECFDISHISGSFVVASLVHFDSARPNKRLYKHFKVRGTPTPLPPPIDRNGDNRQGFAPYPAVAQPYIPGTLVEDPEHFAERRSKGAEFQNTSADSHRVAMHPPEAGGSRGSSAHGVPVAGNDDYAAMREVVFRHYKRLAAEGKKLPQLIVIDGGAGQLKSALAAFIECGITPPMMIGLAKREETFVFSDGRKSLTLPRNHDGLRLLQRVRDEAHRFANSFNADWRSRALKTSILDEIPGIGPVKRKKLFDKFRTIESLKKAAPEKLAKVIGPKLAHRVGEFIDGK